MKVINIELRWCVVCFLWYLDWVIWPNYKVVDFQPQQGTATVLDSGASIAIYYSPAHPTCISCFPGSFYLLPPSYRPPPVAFVVVSNLSLTPAPHLLSRCGTVSTWTSTTPATSQTQLLVSVPRTMWLLLPPFPAPVCPPFSDLGLRPGPYHPRGGFPVP